MKDKIDYFESYNEYCDNHDDNCLKKDGTECNYIKSMNCFESFIKNEVTK